jgi:hypothetical protein
LESLEALYTYDAAQRGTLHQVNRCKLLPIFLGGYLSRFMPANTFINLAKYFIFSNVILSNFANWEQWGCGGWGEGVFKEIQTKNPKLKKKNLKDQQQQGLPFTLIKLKKGHFITIPYFLENTIIWLQYGRMFKFFYFHGLSIAKFSYYSL